MDQLTRAMAALLRWTALFLPPGRQEWAEAVASEAPAGRERLPWLIGGLWVVVREAGMLRRTVYTAAALAAGSIIVWLDWHPGSANPAMPINRTTMIGVVLLLAFLPWAIRPVFGPVADGRPARIVRIGGYLTLYALLLVMDGLSRFAGSRFDHMHAFDQANWEADMRSGAVVGLVLIIVMIGGYATAILAVTSRRASVVPSPSASPSIDWARTSWRGLTARRAPVDHDTPRARGRAIRQVV